MATQRYIWQPEQLAERLSQKEAFRKCFQSRDNVYHKEEDGTAVLTVAGTPGGADMTSEASSTGAHRAYLDELPRVPTDAHPSRLSSAQRPLVTIRSDPQIATLKHLDE